MKRFVFTTEALQETFLLKFLSGGFHFTDSLEFCSYKPPINLLQTTEGMRYLGMSPLYRNSKVIITGVDK